MKIPCKAPSNKDESPPNENHRRLIGMFRKSFIYTFKVVALNGHYNFDRRRSSVWCERRDSSSAAQQSPGIENLRKVMTSKKQRDKMLFMSPSSELKLDLTFRELQGLRS